MLSRPTLVLLRHSRALWAPATTAADQGMGDRVKHVAEEIKHAAVEVEHRVEDAVHKVADFVHENRAHAREEAERGMFTADDIREAADQMKEAQKHMGQWLHPNHPHAQQHDAKPPRQYTPDEEEQLLEDASNDLGKSWRQKELEGLRNVLRENQDPEERGDTHVQDEKDRKEWGGLLSVLKEDQEPTEAKRS